MFDLPSQYDRKGLRKTRKAVPVTGGILDKKMYPDYNQRALADSMGSQAPDYNRDFRISSKSDWYHTNC